MEHPLPQSTFHILYSGVVSERAQLQVPDMVLMTLHQTGSRTSKIWPTPGVFRTESCDLCVDMVQMGKVATRAMSDRSVV